MSYGFDMGFAQANSLQEAMAIALESNIQKHEPQLSGQRIPCRKSSSCDARNSGFQRWGSNNIQRY